MKEYMLTMAAIGGDAPRRVIAETEDGRTVAMLVPDLHAGDAAAVAAARRLRVGKTPHIDLYRIKVEGGSRLIGEGRVKGTSSYTRARRWRRR
jgi:hypothetical protein